MNNSPQASRLAAAIQSLFDLPETLEYTGEFGPELILFFPFCSWLSKEGLLKTSKVKIYRGMRCFYDHLDCLELVEKDDGREYVAPDKRPTMLPIKNEHSYGSLSPFHYFLDLRTKFLAKPMLRDVAAGSDKPLLIVHNKYNSEWSGPPVNFIDLPTLDHIFSMLKHRFFIVYIRHRPSVAIADGFSKDHNTLKEGFDDLGVLMRHPEVVDFEELYAKHKVLGGQQDLNTFKNVLYSRCYRFISSQGGGAHHIAMYSNSVLAILHRRGRETELAYTKGFYRFATNPPPKLAVCSDSEQLIRALSDLFKS